MFNMSSGLGASTFSKKKQHIFGVVEASLVVCDRKRLNFSATI